MDRDTFEKIVEKRKETNEKEYSWVKNCVSVLSILLGLIISFRLNSKINHNEVESWLFIVCITSNGLCILSGLLFLYADTDTSHRLIREHVKHIEFNSSNVKETQTVIGQRKIFSILRTWFFVFLFSSIISLIIYATIKEYNNIESISIDDNDKEDYAKIDSIKNNGLKTVTIPLAQLDSLLVSSHDTSKDFSAKLKGRFILKDAEYAGLNFYNQTRITWTNEMDPGHPDSLIIRWINHTTFYTRNIQRVNEKCPPNIQIYQVVFFDGQHLILSELSTGWYDHPDSHVEFYRNDNIED